MTSPNVNCHRDRVDQRGGFLFTMAIPNCAKCDNQPKLRRQISANGAETFMWYCLLCDRIATPSRPFIKRVEVEEWVKAGKLPSIEAIPILNDYRTNPCEVCGSMGVEYHHWWPQSLAHLAEHHSQWPGAYLCRRCHVDWHKNVTPTLNKRKPNEY